MTFPKETQDSASVARAWRHPDFRRGARGMSDVALGIAAWGLVTGVAMAKSGMSTDLAVLMTVMVYAGSAQLAAVALLAAGSPLWVVWATAFCVNLRFVVFSAQWRPHFGHLPLRRRLLLGYFAGDLNYVLFLRRFPHPRPEDEGRERYFWGGVSVNWTAWQVASLVGIAFAETIPSHWGLGFAGTLALLGLLASLVTDRVTAAAAVVAGCAAVAAYALPLRLNMLVAISAALAVGVLWDHLRGLTPEAGRPQQDSENVP